MMLSLSRFVRVSRSALVALPLLLTAVGCSSSSSDASAAVDDAGASSGDGGSGAANDAGGSGAIDPSANDVAASGLFVDGSLLVSLYDQESFATCTGGGICTTFTQIRVAGADHVSVTDAVVTLKTDDAPSVTLAYNAGYDAYTVLGMPAKRYHFEIQRGSAHAVLEGLLPEAFDASLVPAAPVAGKSARLTWTPVHDPNANVVVVKVAAPSSTHQSLPSVPSDSGSVDLDATTFPDAVDYRVVVSKRNVGSVTTSNGDGNASLTLELLRQLTVVATD